MRRHSPLKDGNLPAPAREARFLLAVADRNGGRAKMKELIDITPEQKAELEELVRAGQLGAFQLRRIIIFREQVRLHFDRLVEKNGGLMRT
jgi:hypothetical protein